MSDYDDGFIEGMALADAGAGLAELYVGLFIVAFVLFVIKIAFMIAFILMEVALAVLAVGSVLLARQKFKCREDLLPLCYCGSCRPVRESVRTYIRSDPIDPQPIWIKRVLFKDPKRQDNVFWDFGNVIAGILYLPKVIKTYRAWHKEDAGEDLVIGVDAYSDRKKLQDNIQNFLKNNKPTAFYIPKWLFIVCGIITVVVLPVTICKIIGAVDSATSWSALLVLAGEFALAFVFLKSIYVTDNINTYNNVLSAGKKLDEMMGKNVFEDYEGIY